MSDETYEGNMGEGQFEPDAYDDAGYEDPGYEAESAAEALRAMIAENVSQAVEPVQRNLDQVQNQLREEEHQEALFDLETRYPALATDAVADATVRAAQDYVHQQGLPPAAAMDPAILEMVFLRSAGQRAQQPVGAQPTVNGSGVVSYGEGTAEVQRVNAEILSASGKTNVWGW